MTWASDRQGRLYYASAALLAWYGVRFTTLFEYGWKILIYPDDLNALFRSIEDTMPHGLEFSVSFRGRHHSGEWRWLAVVGRPMGESFPHIYRGFAKPIL
jgi:PAS domain-containing protein